MILTPNTDIEEFVFGDLDMPVEAAAQFREAFSKSRVKSIDAFLETYKDRELQIGKRLIVANVAIRENEDLLYPNQGDWLMTLFDIMGRGSNAACFPDNRLSIVTFNYDRSYEMALTMHLRYKYQMEINEALALVNSMPIYHVYGSLGKLTYHADGRGKVYDGKWWGLNRNVDNIQLVHDELEESTSLKEARRSIQDAERVIFLGFGFHEKNCLNIFGEERRRGSKWRAARLGMTDGECYAAMKWIPRLYPDSQHPSWHEVIHREVQGVMFGGKNWDALQFMRENMDFLLD